MQCVCLLCLQIEAPLADAEEVIQCNVKLTGSSVLQGVKQCIISDIVILPVPTVLSTLHSSSSNTVPVHHSYTPEHSQRQNSSLGDKENNPIDQT